jgi:hypothetical protein
MIVALPMGVIQMLAERAAGLRGIDAFKRGWQVLKANLSTTLVLGVIFLAIGVIVVVLVIVALVIIDLSEGPTKILGHVDPKPWMVIPFCGGPIVIVLSALIGGVASAFASATWTLAYREMIRRTDQPAAVVQPGEV